MDSHETLLIEIGTEELPPKSLRQLATALANEMAARLLAAGLVEAVDQVSWYGAPRRLAVSVAQVAVRQPDQQVERRGPATKSAWDDDGNPAKATLGFARSCGVEPDQLETLSTDKGEWLVYRSVQPGANAAALIPEMLFESVRQLPIARRMRWGSGDGEFVRPVHWLVALLGAEVVEFELFGVASGRESQGHRFHANQAVSLADADSYLPVLRDAHVVADYTERQQLIIDQAQALAAKADGEVVLEPGLLDEVTGLVEWPHAVLGHFDAEFLQVPQEALIAAMADHQKYFHLLDNQQRLQPCFITIANLDCADPALIVAGNERVLRARLADARFFWEQDSRRSLAELATRLEAVVFQQQLGSMAQKSQRIATLAAAVLDATASGFDRQLAGLAATLCKADLLADMVGEFPALQGVMGRYYAQADGLDEAVGIAIEEHYLPRFAGDALPTTELGQALALADRIDTLVGIFAIGSVPTGDKDPFGLRRAALGVLRIQLEAGVDLELDVLLARAVAGLPDGLQNDSLAAQVKAFIIDRFRGYLDAGGYAHDQIEAVLAVDSAKINDAQARLVALQQFCSHPAAQSLAVANKRVANILQKSGASAAHQVDQSRLTEPQELALYQALESSAVSIEPLIAQRDYLAVFEQLAQLREPVDAFFDAVMVMADDADLRANRLALLRQMRELFLQVADFSCLQG